MHGKRGLLRHELAQRGEQRCSLHIPQLDHFGDDFIRAFVIAFARADHVHAVLLGVNVRHDFGHIALVHGGKTMHLQGGEEHVV